MPRSAAQEGRFSHPTARAESCIATRDVSALTDQFRVRSAGIIAVHNHPSGDPTPSREDMEITTRLPDQKPAVSRDRQQSRIRGDLSPTAVQIS